MVQSPDYVALRRECHIQVPALPRCIGTPVYSDSYPDAVDPYRAPLRTSIKVLIMALYVLLVVLRLLPVVLRMLLSVMGVLLAFLLL